MAYFLYGALVWLGLVASSFAEELKIIAHTTSGGHMVHARLFAKHAAKHTESAVIVRAMPGAAGISAANYLFNAAPKDGSEIGTIDTRVFINGVLKPDSVQYNLTKFNWLGSATDNRKEPFILWAKAGSSPLIAGSESSLPINHIKLVNQILGWNVQEIVGYSDSSQVRLAFERNEINLVAFNLTGVRTTSPSWLKDPSILPMVQYGSGLIRHPDYPFLPTVMSFAKSDQDKELLGLFEKTLVLGRAFAAPPNISENRLKSLRHLFNAVMLDEEYRKEANAIGTITNPIDWHESETIVKSLAETPESVLKILRQL
jgi:hypothetical protein